MLAWCHYFLLLTSSQGADILAHTDDEHHQYRVYMPDFLKGQFADQAWFPPDTEEKQKKMGAFFQGPANPPDTAKRVPEMAKALAEKYSGVSEWGILGYCWGGKVGRVPCETWVVADTK